MSVEDWLSHHRSTYRQSDLETLSRPPDVFSTVDTISELLRGTLGPEEAAETLTSFYDPFISTDKENGVVWQLWAIVASAVRNLGHVSEYTDRVIALLKSISQLRKVHENGEDVTVEGQTYWKDLPGFGLTLWLYCMDWRYDDPEEEAARLISGTTFAATFFSQGFGVEYMGSWALETLMNGLESSLDSPEDVQEVNRDIPAAATWIHLAGNDIFEYCRKNHERGPPKDNPYVWKGDQGYSLERWIFWKRRFHELSHAKEMNAHAQALASEALSKMETIESQGSASRVV